MPDVRVSLAGGTISVDKNKVKASRGAADTVTWASNDGQFGIEFQPGSGIADPVITNVGGTRWQGSSGGFSKDGTFKYDVTSPGLTPLDPELEVVP